MNRNRAYGVVNMELIIKEPYSEYNYQSGNSAYYNRAEGVAHIAGSGYCNQTGE